MQNLWSGKSLCACADSLKSEIWQVRNFAWHRLHSGLCLENQLRLLSYFRNSLRLRPESTPTLRLVCTSTLSTVIKTLSNSSRYLKVSTECIRVAKNLIFDSASASILRLFPVPMLRQIRNFSNSKEIFKVDSDSATSYQWWTVEMAQSKNFWSRTAHSPCEKNHATSSPSTPTINPRGKKTCFSFSIRAPMVR